ncbi:hypothetical protein GGI23_002904 [Coemansia sp. RSA 2559]|nr:hypothetical protein GGI23_002904 [Coemansia sp. RSA 2559]
MGSKATSKKDKSKRASKTEKIKDIEEKKRKDTSVITSKKTSKRKRRESVSSDSSSDSEPSSSSGSDDSSPDPSNSSSGSDSDDSSSDSSDSSIDSDSDDSDSSSESSDSPSEDSEDELPQSAKQLASQQKRTLAQVQTIKRGLLPYVATNIDLMQQQKAARTDVDRTTKEKFKQLYMEHVTTGFGTDLDRLRKEDDIDEDGLEMLVDVLEAAVESFADGMHDVAEESLK